MATTRNVLGSGNSPLATTALIGTVSTALTAAGTNQATALALPSDINEFTTTASGTGAILSANNTPGDMIAVFNAGANTLAVYPESGSSINAIATNSSFAVTSGSRALFIKVSATKYYSILSA